MIILKSTETSLTIEMEIDAVTAADIYSKSIFVGLPNNVFPKTELIFKEESSIPFRSEKSNSEIFSWTNIQILKNLNTAVLKIDPKSSNNSYFNKMRIEITFQKKNQVHRLAKKNESKLLSNKIFNWNIAKKWIIKEKRMTTRSSDQPSGKWISFQVYDDGINTISSSLLINAVDDNPSTS